MVGGVVFEQDDSYPASEFIPMTIVTGRIAPAGTEGWFRLRRYITTGEHRDDHCIEGDVSFDDGHSFIPCVDDPVEIETGVAAAQYAVGETTSLPWAPRRRKGQGVNIRLRTTSLDGAPSEGQTLSNIQLEVIRNRKARRAVKQQ